MISSTNKTAYMQQRQQYLYLLIFVVHKFKGLKHSLQKEKIKFVQETNELYQGK